MAEFRSVDPNDVPSLISGVESYAVGQAEGVVSGGQFSLDDLHPYRQAIKALQDQSAVEIYLGGSETTSGAMDKLLHVAFDEGSGFSYAWTQRQTILVGKYEVLAELAASGLGGDVGHEETRTAKPNLGSGDVDTGKPPPAPLPAPTQLGDSTRTP
jgi:hypothetical protein